jgi:hypothetical protein
LKKGDSTSRSCPLFQQTCNAAKVLDVKEGRYSQAKAAQLLKLSVRQVRRLQRRWPRAVGCIT